MDKHSFLVLVIDDMKSIHEDFERILSPEKKSSAKKEVDLKSELLFGLEKDFETTPEFEINFAFQGEEGIRKVKEKLGLGERYAVVFVDMVMPPGIDGLKTISQIYRLDPTIEFVVCSAYTLYAWKEIVNCLDPKVNLHQLNKPFSPSEVHQLACKLSKRWLDRDKCKNQFQKFTNEQEKTSEKINEVTRHLNKAIESLKKLKP